MRRHDDTGTPQVVGRAVEHRGPCASTSTEHTTEASRSVEAEVAVQVNAVLAGVRRWKVGRHRSSDPFLGRRAMVLPLWAEHLKVELMHALANTDRPVQVVEPLCQVVVRQHASSTLSLVCFGRPAKSRLEADGVPDEGLEAERIVDGARQRLPSLAGQSRRRGWP